MGTLLYKDIKRHGRAIVKYTEMTFTGIVTVWRRGLSASNTLAAAPRDCGRRGGRLLLHNICCRAYQLFAGG